MGHIKEPKGVDFVISSDPLTDKARQEITEFIRNYKNTTVNKKRNPPPRFVSPRNGMQ